MTYRVGIDIGGTFTDFAMMSDDGLRLHKNLSTPANLADGVMQGLQQLADLESLSLADFLAKCDTIVHGTTVADNTLIEMNGALTGLITTEGFRDEMEYRRGFKENIWDVRLPPPIPITPRRRRLTVSERVLADGAVHKALDEDSVRACCARLRAQGVESVAVSLLFSFLNPQHELRVAEIVSEELPGASVSLSHQVLPRSPEFDRTSTTVVNAYVAGRVNSYLEDLVDKLREAGYRKRLMVMQANGGVMTRDYIKAAPIRVLASGPAGGVIGSAHTGLAKGHENLLCVDMGGTSYDISLVLNGEAPAVAGWNLHHRYLVGIPMVQVETLGAGGGSICYLRGGELVVGPRSAGSTPGPICYGRGGIDPTITDALVMMGVLSPDEEFAGGDFQLTMAGVAAAFESLGEALDKSAAEVALDCWRLVNANMANGVRRITAGKGVDSRDLTMLAYGGNGPIFACKQAEALGISTVLVPRASPTFSALGTLVADPRFDEERSYAAAVDDIDTARLRKIWMELAEKARGHFADAGFDGQVNGSFRVNMRYPGQNWSLCLELHAASDLNDFDFIGEDLPAKMVALFDNRHQQEYGHTRSYEKPELTGLRLVASVDTPSPAIASGFLNDEQAQPEPVKHRDINLGEGYQSTPIYTGAAMAPGVVIPGPAIIEETFSTLVIYPGWTLYVDCAGDYEMRSMQ